MKTLRKQLQEQYGLRGYRITRDGEVHYRKTDWSGTYWAFGGWIEDVKQSLSLV